MIAAGLRICRYCYLGQASGLLLDSGVIFIKCLTREILVPNTNVDLVGEGLVLWTTIHFRKSRTIVQICVLHPDPTENDQVTCIELALA